MGFRQLRIMAQDDANHCDCCKDRHDFDLTDELMGELLQGKVTVFAGAGVSTESRQVLPDTFYETIAAELGEANCTRTFPELMTTYCGQPNGRIKLLKAIMDRLSYVDSHPELARQASAFHRELGTFFPVRSIVTTNWDTYFERYCAATPFVTDPDLAFWEAAERRVLKIHGSVSNLGSIVATTGDYEKCRENLSSGIIGSLLKTILATQTVIFVGYSFSDSDFTAIYDFVKTQMKSLHRQAYVVTPSAKDCERFAAEGFIPIRTDGAYFFSRAKERAVSQHALLDDKIYEAASELLEAVEDEHDELCQKVEFADCPEAIYAASYQDGMLHALERAIQMRGTGRYSNPGQLARTISGYLDWQKRKRQRRVYEDVAYIEGYINGLTYLLIPEEERAADDVPMYFIFGVDADIFSLSGFLELLTIHPSAHKAARRRAQRHVERLPDSGSMIFHHPPQL